MTLHVPMTISHHVDGRIGSTELHLSGATITMAMDRDMDDGAQRDLWAVLGKLRPILEQSWTAVVEGDDLAVLDMRGQP